jgi:hypothetical protein
MSAGRKTMTATPAEKPAIEGELIQGDLNAAIQLGELKQAVSIDQMRLSEWIGARKGIALLKKLADVSDFKILAEIKESKQYKGLQVFDLNGKLLTVSTWDGFCESQGLSRQHVDECIENLSKLGEDFLKISSEMGVGFRELRKLRKLPEQERELIINGEAVQAGDRESLIDMIEEQAIRHAKAKEESDKKIADLQADIAAKASRMERDATRINTQEEEIARLTSIPKTPALIEEEQIAAVMAQSQLVVREVEAGLRGQIAKLERLFEDGVLPNHVRLAEQQAITQILQAARLLAGDFGITLKVEDQAPQQLLWLQNAEKLFGDGAQPTDDDGILLPPDGE